MKKMLCTLLAGITGVSLVYARSLADYLQEAQSSFDAKDVDQAVAVMEAAVKEYPDNSAAYVKLGDYIAETAQGYVDFFTVLPRAFAMWDTAIALDPDNVDARFDRGSWGTYVPQSLGQLDKGIADLEFVVAAVEKTTDPAITEQFLDAYSCLAEGYRKNWEFQKAKETYNKVIEMDPGTRDAKRAQTNIDQIIHFEKWLHEQEKQKVPDSPEIMELGDYIEVHPNDVARLLILGNAYLEANKDEEAARVFERAVAADLSNIKAYKMLAFALKRIYAQGYDPRISMDHNYMTDFVFKILNVLDKAISIAPDDMELKLMRGQVGLDMFFFPGRREQAIDDLQMIIESDASDVIKGAARYELGRGHQKEAITSWLKAVSEYPNTSATDSIFKELHGSVPHVDLSQYTTPVVVMDFIMGFRDELAPQTAVWVETNEGTFVKTIYVSGFTGYARARGRLPQWQASADFFDVDAVTGASVDMGRQVFMWNLKNALGEKVKSGDYVLKVEVTFWPSRQYQCVEAPIAIGKKEDHVVVKEGNLIPYLEVRYLP
jgi:tetratricopeptide (TPR) repeat protein